MRNTGYVYAQRYLLHDPGSWHPERPDRLKAIHTTLKEDNLLELLILLRPDYAPLEWVERLHDPDYIRRFQEACEQGKHIFEVADCGISRESYRTALLADVYHMFKPSKNYWRGFDQWTFLRGQETEKDLIHAFRLSLKNHGGLDVTDPFQGEKRRDFIDFAEDVPVCPALNNVGDDGIKNQKGGERGEREYDAVPKGQPKGQGMLQAKEFL